MHMLSALIRRTLGKKPSEETVLTQGRKQFVDHLVAPNRGPYSGPLFDFKSLITNSINMYNASVVICQDMSCV